MSKNTLKAIMFDLDGTLLPMNEEEFTKGYFELLCKQFVPLGYEKDTFIKTIWTGTKLMLQNNGAHTNEFVFWDYFAQVYGKEKVEESKLEFEKFYMTEFENTKKYCKENKFAKEIIQYAKSKGIKTILSSNPLFPKVAMNTRLSFIQLNCDDFDYISSYEISHYSKPNPNYFQEILDNNSLHANEIILFGNSESEDIDPAKICNIQGFLVGDCISLKNEIAECKILNYDQIFDVIDNNL